MLIITSSNCSVEPMRRIVNISLFWILLISLEASNVACADNHPVRSNDDVLEVGHSPKTVVSISSGTVMRQRIPTALFGFNVHHYYFQQDFWQEKSQSVNPDITDALKAFPGALYRYPGGLIANRFWWDQAVGPVAERLPQKAVQWAPPAKVLFGVDEYLKFVKSVGGRPWYVLNLVGWDAVALTRQRPSEEVARSNASLAAHIKQHSEKSDIPRYYQLGNELDRADYQWSAEMYIERAKDTISAILAVDPDARFVAFLREFDWKYKGDITRGVSRYQDYIRDVMNGLPMVNDFSLHFYYQPRGSVKETQQIQWRLRQFSRAITAARETRQGMEPNVWITEHARAIDFGAVKATDAKFYTSNLAGALRTGDFMIALAQMPEVKGACWHGLNAMPWQLFDTSNDLRPNPVYWGLRVLRVMDLPVVLATHTDSPDNSGNAGGYDVRSVAFTNDARSRLGLWIVNRAPHTIRVEVNYEPWQSHAVKIHRYYIAGKEGIDPDERGLAPTVELKPDVEKRRFDGSGTITLSVPPASLSSFVLEKD